MSLVFRGVAHSAYIGGYKLAHYRPVHLYNYRDIVPSRIKRAAARGLRGLSGYSIACARVTREFKVMHIYRFVSRGKETKEAAKTRGLLGTAPLATLAQPALFPFPRTVASAIRPRCAPDETGRHIYRTVSVLGTLPWNSERATSAGQHVLCTR